MSGLPAFNRLLRVTNVLVRTGRPRCMSSSQVPIEKRDKPPPSEVIPQSRQIIVKQGLLKKIPVEFHGVQERNFNDETAWVTIYRCPLIGAFRVFCKVKVYLTIISLVVSAKKILDMINASFAFSGRPALVLSVTALVGLHFTGDLFKRIVCQIYCSEDLKFLRVCRLTAFGNRLDIVVPVECLLPLSENNENIRKLFVKCRFLQPEKIDLAYDTLEFYDEELLIPLRLGGVIDREKFEKTLGSILTIKPGTL